MDPNLVASLLSPDPSNTPPPQSDALAPITLPPTVPADHSQQSKANPTTSSSPNVPRPSTRRNANLYPFPTKPPPSPPYVMPIGGPPAMAIDPYGNLVPIGGVVPFPLPLYAPESFGSFPIGPNFGDIGSNVGNIGPSINSHNGMVILNGRDWSQIAPSQWPLEVRAQYQQVMQAGAQGMAAGAKAVKQAEQMMQNMGTDMGMGMGMWDSHLGSPHGMRNRPKGWTRKR